MRFDRRIAVAAALIVALAGCAAEPRPRGRWAGAGAAPGARLFVSPAGQVFRPAPGTEQPIRAWFRQADADGDGALTYAEFRADFARAFAGFDSDGDGEIEPDEVTRYETETFPEMATRGGPGGGMGMRRGGRGRGGMRPGGRSGGRGGGEMARGGGPGMAMIAGAAHFGLLPISHPIMDADTDMNRGVTRAEFDAVAGRRFNMLNSAGTGRLVLAELVARRLEGRARRGRGPEGGGGDTQ